MYPVNLKDAPALTAWSAVPLEPTVLTDEEIDKIYDQARRSSTWR